MPVSLSPNSEADLPTLRTRLEDARHNVRVCQVAALRPGISAAKRHTYRNLEEAYRAEVMLLRKALAHRGQLGS